MGNEYRCRDVEPAFATLKRNPEGIIHGVATLFTIEDAVKLNVQEAVGRAYNLEKQIVTVYDGSELELEVEVYVPTKSVALDALRWDVHCVTKRF
jgi:hypothetical protein